MQANDSFAAHVKSKQAESLVPAETSLITLERAQKLDLLMHLIANLRQSLVICGPEGIGKTTLLEELKHRKQEVWRILTIQGASNLSFEALEAELERFLVRLNNDYKSQGLSTILSACDNQKIVLIIDDAGLLVPGLISSIIQFASAYPCLRVVFALTHDELHIKSSSDRAIDDCHFIELPPLTEKQCAIFLQNLSAMPGAVLSFNAISDSLVGALYKNTHGIPGKIIAELPKLSNYTVIHRTKWGAVGLVAAVIAFAINLWVFDQESKPLTSEELKQPLLLQKPENVDISSPVISADNRHSSADIFEQKEIKKEIVKPSAQISNRAPETQHKETGIVEKEQVNNEDTETLVAEQKTDNAELQQKPSEPAIEQVHEALEKIPMKTVLTEDNSSESVKTDTKKIIPVEKRELAISDDADWLLSQPKKHYTLQLMVLSKQQSVHKLYEKNRKLKERLKYIQVTKQGQEKYIVIYGSFKTYAQATKEMKLLPVSYRKSWVRRFENLQKYKQH